MTKKPREQGYEGTGMGPGDHQDDRQARRAELDEQNYEGTGLGPKDHDDDKRDDDSKAEESDK